MTTLQEYLNNLENKEQIKEINLQKINQERGELTELLEGGELDLTGFTNLEKVEIEPKLLKTPLTKLEVSGLTNLKELIWKETKEDSEEDKKLWEELGISGDISKKGVVKEVKRLVGLWNDKTSESLQPVKVHFATEKSPQEKLQGKESISIIPENEGDGYNIYLNLERKDKAGNFCPSLVFWTLTRELSTIGSGEAGKNPNSWTHFNQQLEWVKDNLNENYQKDFELLLTPSTFPTDQLEIKEILSIYYPNSENIPNSQESKATVGKEIADKTWQTIREKLLELTSQELSKNPSEEDGKKLVLKAFIDNQNGYEIIIQYHQDNPFKEKIAELITTTPLKSEAEHSKQVIEELKKEKAQLPTPENFEKLSEQKQKLENYLQDLMTEEEYNKVKEEIEKNE